MPINSAGILMYRRSGDGIEVLLVHPGGPFWRKRDLGAWSLPKGELNDGENPEAAARREFEEEIGVEGPGPLQPLGEVRQRAGKTVLGYAMEGDLDVITFAATTSRLNGHAEAAGPRIFLKLIAPRGSRFPSPRRRFLQASARFSIVLRRSGRTHHDRMLRKYQYAPRPNACDAL
jgi:predicted NUDIX family NTP pyrophosphohydrolase